MVAIRPLQEVDIPQLEELFLITRRETFYWEKWEKFHLKDFKKETEGECVFVAEDANKIIGFISLWEKESPPFIHHLFIASEHQRRGVGKLLIESLLSWLPRPYRLKCLARNQGALAFYRKNQWIEIDRGLSEEGVYLLLEYNDEK